MSKTIFYSWQSDLPNNTNRSFIENALKKAISELQKDAILEDARRDEPPLALDKDTQGVPGSPPIVDTIFKKIDQCSVFVPDLTFVAKSDEGRLVPNPNVLIEYGWASRAIGHPRIVPIMNTAFGEPTNDTLPFDMRHLRHPIKYSLNDKATTEEKNSIQSDLVKTLISAIRSSLDASESTQEETHFFSGQQAIEEDPATFFSPDETFTIPGRSNANNKQLHLRPGQKLFLRLIPQTPLTTIKTNKDAIDLIANNNLSPLGNPPGWSNSRNKYGAFTYNASNEEGEIYFMTQLFHTGEIWAIDALTIEEQDLKRHARTDFGFFPSSALKNVFCDALKDYLKFMQETLKIEMPIKMIVGATNVKGYRMALSNSRFDGYAHDEHIITEVLLKPGLDVHDYLKPFFGDLWKACGLNAPDITTL